jgi:hypothetical protein
MMRRSDAPIPDGKRSFPFLAAFCGLVGMLSSFLCFSPALSLTTANLQPQPSAATGKTAFTNIGFSKV